MEPVIELRSEMEQKRGKPFVLSFWALFFLLVISFLVGVSVGSPTVSSELNRQEAESVAYDVFQKCDELFIPHGKDLYATQLANEKCQKIQNVALNSGWKKREKKR